LTILNILSAVYLHAGLRKSLLPTSLYNRSPSIQGVTPAKSAVPQGKRGERHRSQASTAASVIVAEFKQHPGEFGNIPRRHGDAAAKFPNEGA
jgi:hypothetical protein